MKKSSTPKTLKLATETLRSLDNVTLSDVDVKGGYIVGTLVNILTCPRTQCGCLPFH